MPADPYFGVFARQAAADGPSLTTRPEAPPTLPDPATGRALRIATVEISGAICPTCRQKGRGGFVSFVSDLRLVFACPHCHDMVWMPGA